MNSANLAQPPEGLFRGDDRSYDFIGIRGVGPLASYGNEEIVAVDGHSVNNN